MIEKVIIYCGVTTKVACDEKCNKAWGRNTRQRDNDEEMLLDDRLGEAPIDPGTSEGGHVKPRALHERLNKWCVRECERCTMMDIGGDITKPIELPKF